MTVRKGFAEHATNVLHENIELFGTSNIPNFGCNIFIAPKWLAGPKWCGTLFSFRNKFSLDLFFVLFYLEEMK